MYTYILIITETFDRIMFLGGQVMSCLEHPLFKLLYHIFGRLYWLVLFYSKSSTLKVKKKLRMKHVEEKIVYIGLTYQVADTIIVSVVRMLELYYGVYVR